MKICSKCGFKGNDTDNYCPKCAGKMKIVDDSYTGVFQIQQKKKKVRKDVNKFPFVVKLVVGILAMLFISVFKLGGIWCVVLGALGGICSISMCAWYNKMSGFIPAILFFLASSFTGKHPLAGFMCIVYIALEIAVGIKIKKK